MRPSEPWSAGSAGTAPADYSGSGWGWGAGAPEPCAAPELPHGRALLPALYLLAFAVGLPGNAAVLWLLAGRRGPRRLVDTFALHLAAADLGLLLPLPLWALAAARGGRWPFGAALCRLSGFALAATRCAGALLQAGLSLGRYLAVARPPRARPRRPGPRAPAACRAVWAAALLAGLPSLASRRLRPLRGGAGSQCGEEPSDAFQALSLALLLLTCALPLAVSLLCSCLLSRRLRRPPRLGRARTTALRILFAVEAAFVGSWLPFGVLRAVFHLARLGALPLPCGLLLALRWGLGLATCLAFASCCANPLIYLLLDRSLRARAWRGLCGRAGRPARGGSSAASLPVDDGGRGCRERARTPAPSRLRARASPAQRFLPPGQQPGHPGPPAPAPPGPQRLPDSAPEPAQRSASSPRDNSLDTQDLPPQLPQDPSAFPTPRPSQPSAALPPPGTAGPSATATRTAWPPRVSCTSSPRTPAPSRPRARAAERSGSSNRDSSLDTQDLPLQLPQDPSAFPTPHLPDPAPKPAKRFLRRGQRILRPGQQPGLPGPPAPAPPGPQRLPDPAPSPPRARAARPGSGSSTRGSGPLRDGRAQQPGHPQVRGCFPALPRGRALAEPQPQPPKSCWLPLAALPANPYK
ncbi:probable G-protein coupled receptor 25 [Canis lupus baileyi]